MALNSELTSLAAKMSRTTTRPQGNGGRARNRNRHRHRTVLEPPPGELVD